MRDVRTVVGEHSDDPADPGGLLSRQPVGVAVLGVHTARQASGVQTESPSSVASVDCVPVQGGTTKLISASDL